MTTTFAHSAIPDFYRAFPFPNVRIEAPPAYMTSLLDRVAAPGLLDMDGLWVDVGCGTGEFLAMIARRFTRARFLGIDLSSESLAIAARNLDSAGVSDRTRLIEGDVFNPAVLAEIGGDVSVLSACGSLHLVPDLERLLPRLVASVRAGGQFLLGVYGLHGRWRLEQLRKACFTLVPEPNGYADRVRLIQEALLSQYENVPAYRHLLARYDVPENIPPQWWQDTFLAPYERQFEAADVYDLLEASGCDDVCWLDEPAPEDYLKGEWRQRWELLPRREQMRVLDTLRQTPFLWFLAKKR